MKRSIPVLLLALSTMLPAAPAGAQTQDPIYFQRGERLSCPIGSSRACNSTSTSEPAVRVDSVTGNAWVTDQNGLIGGVNLWRRPAGERFGFADKIDRIPVVTDRNGYALGGGDSDLTVGSTGRVFTSSLWAGSVTLAEYDAEGTQVFQSYYAQKPNIDRQWIASHGEQTLYMSHWDFASPPRNIWVGRSDDGGRIWNPSVSAVGNTLSTGGFTSIGNIITDQGPHSPWEGSVYTMYSIRSNGLNTLFLARSRDRGASFEQIPMWQYDFESELNGGPKERVGTLFPAIAADRAGNLYATWADESNVWFIRSLDGGDTWSAPLRVNDPVDSRTSVFPWITAGSEGRVGIAWVGGRAEEPANPDPHQPFYAWYAQSIDAAGATTPTFERARASDDPMHNAGICLSGLACDTGGTLDWPDTPVGQAPVKQGIKLLKRMPTTDAGLSPDLNPNSDSDNRNLAEVVTLAVDVDGYVLVAYPDDYERGADSATISVVAKQATGARLYAPGDFPNPDYEPMG